MTLDKSLFPGTPQRVFEPDESTLEAEYHEQRTLQITRSEDGLELRLFEYSCDPTEAEVAADRELLVSLSGLTETEVERKAETLATGLFRNRLGMQYESECFDCDLEFQGYLETCPECGSDDIISTTTERETMLNFDDGIPAEELLDTGPSIE